MTAKIFMLASLLLAGCSTLVAPPEAFVREDVQTGVFRLASWQKLLAPGKTVRIYIEGDGYAFNAHGRPSTDPTPKGKLVRELAFGDPHPNVVYLARPCQYVKDDSKCREAYWTTSRFAPEVIASTAEAVRRIAGRADVVLIGFSGGAQVAGLVAMTAPDIEVKKLVTVAGNLDHKTWTQDHKLLPLTGSMALSDYKTAFEKLPQTHFVGSRDQVIEPYLVKAFVGPTAVVHEVKGATHGSGWRNVYSRIWMED